MMVYELHEKPYVCETPVFDGETKDFSTTTAYDYDANGPILTSQRNIMERVKFNVAATNDIRVSLSKVEPIDAGDSWEIVLGGWGGLQSVIRNKHQGTHLAEVKHTVKDFLKWQCNFEMKMTRKTLGLYDPEGNAIIEYDGFDYKDYKFMYISTGWGSTGTWKINANYDNFNYDKDPSEALDKLKGRLGTFLDDNLSRHSDWVKKINDK